MRVLGIDTATLNASVALVEDREIIAEKYQLTRGAGRRSAPGKPQSSHAEIILPLVKALLESVRLSIGDLSGIAVSVGPGSFTGVRIGLATVMGLTYGSDVRVVGVSTLLANAARVGDFDGLICSFLDARRNEVYAGVFRRRQSVLTRLCEDRVASVDSVLDQIHRVADANSILFIGDGAVKYEMQLRSSLGGRACLSTGDGYASVASSLAVIGYDRLCHSEANDLGSLEPVYLRPSEAESNLKKLA